ncbi:fatty acyl-AMP ligase [Thermobifida alba]|uniref:Fatty acyl-AMP ligase n=1 Tax=Thermobifida alba TaxID=53522 RepID=A0ABY4L6E5_THEAE|nr:fatty acyl-AMP ligase [Thermobifida alba]UPT23224.1 fatty acyl-AMP ligase [Thermobifida alba]
MYGTSDPQLSPPPGTTLVEAFRHWAATRGDEPACTFVDYGTTREGVRHTLTYRELDTRAAAAAAALSRCAAPGDRVALLLPQGLDYIAAFLGCLYTGVIGIPLYAPDLRRSDTRLVSVYADCKPVGSITTTASLPALERLSEQVDTGRVITTSDLAPAPFDPVQQDQDEPSYLQYTSGSTRNPAGIEVTAANLWTSCAQINTFLSLKPGENIVSWLPFFHDMGLVLTVATPLAYGAHAVYFDPYSFVHRPVRWLKLVSEYRSTVTASPNFGLDFAVGRVPEEQRAGLDLSSLRALVNGAEPIREASLRRFSEVYSRYGFNPRAHLPGYGLAEATLPVTMQRVGKGADSRYFDRDALNTGRAVPVSKEEGQGQNAASLVGCGAPIFQEVRIVDPEQWTALPDGHVGEVWVHGPNVCRGYYGRAGETQETFEAELRDDPVKDRHWLRTGDLGFVHEGQLYITSRLKDLLIIHGTNHYPVDIENTVEQALPPVRVGHVAAFAVTPGEEERLVVVAELRADRIAGTDLPAAVAEVARSIRRTHEIDVYDVVLTRPGKIPKTTSGKLQRGACRDRYLAGEFTKALARLRNP